MKKIIAVFSALFMLYIFIPQASANTDSSIVIVDTGIDTVKYPQIKNNIIYEICSVSSSCSNGKSWHEGTGAAEIKTVTQLGVSGQNIDIHGTVMAMSAIAANPNIKIIFVRIATPRSNGSINISATEFANVTKPVFSWVAQNINKYNIRAVSMSMNANADSWCTNNNSNKVSFEMSVKSLTSNNVAVIASTGNGSNKTPVKFPACLPDVVSVGAVNSFANTDGWKISSLSNAATYPVDFYALGALLGITHLKAGTDGQITQGTTGQTSPATAVLSSYWAKNYKGSFNATFEYLKSVSQPTKNASIASTNFVNVLN